MRRAAPLLLLLVSACGPAPPPRPSAAPTSSQTSTPAAASTPPPALAVQVDYKPPSPYHVAATAAPGHTFALFPVKDAVVVPVMKDKNVRTFLVVTGDEIREAPQLLNGLPGVPDQIAGSWSDAIFLASGRTVHVWAKDRWVEVSSQGPSRIARWDAGALALRRQKKSIEFEVFAAPGATVPVKPTIPPVRDKACPMKDADLVGLEGGEIVLVGAGCQHLLMETWIPAQKKWSPTSFENLVFHDETSLSALGLKELLVETIGLSGDGEPYLAAFLLLLQGGTWKLEAERHRTEATWLSAALKPFAKQDGATSFTPDAEPVRSGGRTYVGGVVYRGDDARGAVLLRDRALVARAEL